MMKMMRRMMIPFSCFFILGFFAKEDLRHRKTFENEVFEKCSCLGMNEREGQKREKMK